MSMAGPGVPSDHLLTQTIMMMTRSSGSLADMEGETGRSAPQVLAVSLGLHEVDREEVPGRRRNDAGEMPPPQPQAAASSAPKSKSPLPVVISF